MNNIIEQFNNINQIQENIKLDYNCNYNLINLSRKIVIIDNDENYIYRIDSIKNIKKRILFSELAKCELGFDFFLEEELIFDKEWYGVSRQKKLDSFISADFQEKVYWSLNSSYYGQNIQENIWEFDFCNRVYNDYGEENFKKLHDFFRKYRITLVTKDRVGINDQGKIQCFNYAANITLNQEGKLVST